jgi:tRNA-specific 2-thiouridylase
MSGGVDSSVVAALMHRDGNDVVGISMRLYAAAPTAGRSCCSPDDLADARSVAEQAGFPFYVANYQDEFRRLVVDHFVDEYRRGRTPSPCVLCNDHLKFDTLLRRMHALGGDVLATGHYARIEQIDGRWALLRGVDQAKDQSYFLFGLSRDVLSRIVFPLGGMTKTDVRAMAVELGVPTAYKAESQDICFVGSGSYVDIVDAALSPEQRRPGQIVHAETGEVLGAHDGIHRFTIGQRRGIGIAAPEPLYVKRIDADSGRVEVAPRGTLDERIVLLDRCNWLRWENPPETFEASIQLRYRHKPVAARVCVEGATARVELGAGQPGIAPGQAAVFYDGDEVLGGGWIEQVGE